MTLYAAESLADLSPAMTTFVHDADDDKATRLPRIDPSRLVTLVTYEDRNPS